MGDYVTVSGAAAEIGARPKDISDILYLRRVDVGRCPCLAGRRLIPRDLLPDITAVLRRIGRLPELTTTGEAAR